MAKAGPGRPTKQAFVERLNDVADVLYSNLEVGVPTDYSLGRLSAAGFTPNVSARTAKRLVRLGILQQKRTLILREGKPSGTKMVWTLLVDRENARERIAASTTPLPADEQKYLNDIAAAAEWLTLAREYAQRNSGIYGRLQDLADAAADAGIEFNRDAAFGAFHLDDVRDERLEGAALLLPLIDAMQADLKTLAKEAN